MVRRYAFVVVIACWSVAACGDGGTEAGVRESSGCASDTVVEPGDYAAMNDVDGAGQEYWTVVPGSYDGAPLPVHIILGSGSGLADDNYAGWRPFLDDDDGLVVIVGTDPATDTSVATFEALVEALGADYCIDLDRVHLSGSSWSSDLTASLMCEMPDTFASFADGLGPFRSLGFCEPVPKPLVAITGDRDRTAVAGSVEVWAEINQCDAEPVTTDLGSGITRFTYQGCEADVVYYSFEGMGHQYPAKECVGPAAENGLCAEYADFDVFDVWNDFFAEHPL